MIKADERRLAQLISDPDNDDILDEDIPLIRAGILHLNWVDLSEGRCHPFVTASPTAAAYLHKAGKLTTAHRKTLRGLAKGVRAADIAWARTHIQPKFRR